MRGERCSELLLRRGRAGRVGARDSAQQSAGREEVRPPASSVRPRRPVPPACGNRSGSAQFFFTRAAFFGEKSDRSGSSRGSGSGSGNEGGGTLGRGTETVFPEARPELRARARAGKRQIEAKPSSRGFSRALFASVTLRNFGAWRGTARPRTCAAGPVSLSMGGRAAADPRSRQEGMKRHHVATIATGLAKILRPWRAGPCPLSIAGPRGRSRGGRSPRIDSVLGQPPRESIQFAPRG